MRYFNTAFSLSMVTAPADLHVEQVAEAEAAAWLGGEVKNVANPGHANTLAALSQRLGVDVRGAMGGRVVLSASDEILVGQVIFPPDVPRETTEYSDEQLAKGRFSFVLVTITA